MKKVIWSCWLQGRHKAPEIVRRCLASWETRNPTWELRCLDEGSLRHYVDLPDIAGKTITAASFSDLLRVHLLQEYGGVWVDATLFCQIPLDEWLEARFSQGFFAFDRPGPDRPLSSWFLAATEHNALVSRWRASVLTYWSTRISTDDYFWFHHLFGELCDSEPDFAEAWSRVPKVSADGPHAIQSIGMFAPVDIRDPRVDLRTPVFKLTHRYSREQYRPGTLVWSLFESCPQPTPTLERQSTALGRRVAAARSRVSRTCRAIVERLGPGRAERLAVRRDRAAEWLAEALPSRMRPRFWKLQRPRSIAALKVSTRNLGDHIQILAALQVLKRRGITPAAFIDRDHELASCGALRRLPGPVGLLVNGWFKNNHDHWPPSDKIAPLFLGFHIRLHQCPTLMSEQAIRYYRRHSPIGCRDRYTHSLLKQAGVPAFESNCLTLTLPRRIGNPATQTELFVSSRDTRLLGLVPEHLGPRTHLNHYSESHEFHGNLLAAEELLAIYRTRARLIVTSFLHCALPAIAMGIPVVVFYPPNEGPEHISDRERFSSLTSLVRVYRIEEAHEVDWNPRPADAAAARLGLLDQLETMIDRWSLPRPAPHGPLAPPSALPPPGWSPAESQVQVGGWAAARSFSARCP